jgi:hypothetical protein
VAKKIDNMTHYTLLFPEYSCIFVGDAGQGDAAVACLALKQHASRFSAAFIHDVNPDSPNTGDGGSKEMYTNQGLVFFSTYAGAAAAALRKGLLTPAAARRVASACAAELAALLVTSTHVHITGHSVSASLARGCLHDIRMCGVPEEDIPEVLTSKYGSG